MPIFEYDCSHCEGESFERNVPIVDRDIQCCRNCGIKLDRLIVFKGVVWSPTKNGGAS